MPTRKVGRRERCCLGAARDPVSEAPPPPHLTDRTAVLWQNPAATLGTQTARFEREPLMNSTLTPLGLESRTWNGVEIQRRPLDGSVNATAMCKANGKRWHEYHSNQRSQDYIAALAGALRSAGNPADLIQTITTGPNHLRGTWVHPRIAVDLARWISPAFAVWMDGWFLDALQQQTSATSLPTSQPVHPAWSQIVDAYVAHVSSQMAALDPLDRPRSMRFARPLATDFMQWLASHQFTFRFDVSQLPEAPHFSAGAVVPTPELSRLLGITSNALNYWARHNPIGATRNGWRLIGRGKTSDPDAIKLPPGRSSWLFEKT